VSGFVVGLTGGIGSGKSTVADLFVAHGTALVDTDAIAHELTGSGGGAMPALIDAFGPQIAREDGALDRAAMRQRVFGDSAARARLESILHPLIRLLSDQRCREAASPYVILAVPLLVESGTYRERCDRILVVDCPESVQVERVKVRSGLTEDEIRAIMAAQASRAQRLAVADDVVDNSGNTSTLHGQIAELHIKYLLLSAEKVHASG
jgi:dephospho-CoA kinase